MKEQLALRDALRADLELAESYAALKRKPACQHADDLGAHTAGKTAFARAVLEHQNTRPRAAP